MRSHFLWLRQRLLPLFETHASPLPLSACRDSLIAKKSCLVVVALTLVHGNALQSWRSSTPRRSSRLRKEWTIPNQDHAPTGEARIPAVVQACHSTLKNDLFLIHDWSLSEIEPAINGCRITYSSGQRGGEPKSVDDYRQFRCWEQVRRWPGDSRAGERPAVWIHTFCGGLILAMQSPGMRGAAFGSPTRAENECSTRSVRRTRSFHARGT